MKVPWDIDAVQLDASKHFRNDYMKKWNWDFHDLREAIRDAYKVDQVGKKKYEIYVEKKGSKKIISVYYSEFDTLFVISGSEGTR